ncbi:M48 family metallopeptidase [Ideonella sp. DXS29W]|uniref:M48 family metallopeptidase n=1 Tax=Ideonella lacteola TaxID=2984193 RepID=A0ABU9BYN5_9BURK
MNEIPPAGPRLENRLPDEGINSSTEHPLKEFAWLVGASLATLLVVVLLVGWAARWLAPHIPFATEVALAKRLVDREQKPADAARSAALQAVAQKVAAQMGLPEGMELVVQYEESKVVNAFATIGGRIRVHSALLTKLRSEDELAALLAHEIAHVKHRHVAASMGRGMALGLLLGVVSTDAGAAAAQSALGQATGLALMGYSREQEREADEAALKAVHALYGHVGGAMDLFAHLGEVNPDEPPTALSTHPMSAERLKAMQQLAAEAGWPVTGERTPWPTALSCGASQPANPGGTAPPCQAS